MAGRARQAATPCASGAGRLPFLGGPRGILPTFGAAKPEEHAARPERSPAGPRSHQRLSRAAFACAGAPRPRGSGPRLPRCHPPILATPRNVLCASSARGGLPFRPIVWARGSYREGGRRRRVCRSVGAARSVQRAAAQRSGEQVASSRGEDDAEPSFRGERRGKWAGCPSGRWRCRPSSASGGDRRAARRAAGRAGAPGRAPRWRRRGERGGRRFSQGRRTRSRW